MRKFCFVMPKYIAQLAIRVNYQYMVNGVAYCAINSKRMRIGVINDASHKNSSYETGAKAAFH